MLPLAGESHRPSAEEMRQMGLTTDSRSELSVKLFCVFFFFHQNENYQSKKCRRHVGFHPAQGFTTSCVRVFRYGAKKKRNEECKLNNGVRKSRLLYHRWSSSPRPRLNRITTTELLVLWQQTVKFLFLSPSL